MQRANPCKQKVAVQSCALVSFVPCSPPTAEVSLGLENSDSSLLSPLLLFITMRKRPYQIRLNAPEAFEAASLASTYGSSTPNIHEFSTQTDATSEYTSALSVACGTETTGIQPQLDVTWRYAMNRTANTGFPFGIPRTEGW